MVPSFVAPTVRRILLAEATPGGMNQGFGCVLVRGSRCARGAAPAGATGPLASLSGRRHYDGSCRKKLSAHRIDSEIQPLQGVGPEQDHVARLGEYHEVGRVRAAGVDDGEAAVAFDRPAVGHDEALLALRGDSERVEDGPPYPRQLAPRVHECAGQLVCEPG